VECEHFEKIKKGRVRKGTAGSLAKKIDSKIPISKKSKSANHGGIDLST
jgi:hypothetical protein